MMHLTPRRPFALLSFIAERPGEVVTRDQLFDAVWPEVNVGDAALVTCIQELRRALRRMMPGVPAISRHCIAAVTGLSGKLAVAPPNAAIDSNARASGAARPSFDRGVAVLPT